MEITRTIDARGLSCPQPALMTHQALSELKNGSVEVLLDSGTSRDNVARAAQRAGWRVATSEESGDGFRLVLTR